MNIHDVLQERTVTIRRQTIGGFGLSIKVIYYLSHPVVRNFVMLYIRRCELARNKYETLSQGGAEHKIPIVISKISKEQRGKLLNSPLPPLKVLFLPFVGFNCRWIFFSFRSRALWSSVHRRWDSPGEYIAPCRWARWCRYYRSTVEH